MCIPELSEEYWGQMEKMWEISFDRDIDNFESDSFESLKEKNVALMCRRIRILHGQIDELAEENRKLNERIHQLTSQQGRGKRHNPKITRNRGKISLWKSQGVSNREIARRIGVSEGTIRYHLRKPDAGGARNETRKTPGG